MSSCTGGLLPVDGEDAAVAAMVADLRAEFPGGRARPVRGSLVDHFLTIEVVAGPQELTVDAVRDFLRAGQRAAA